MKGLINETDRDLLAKVAMLIEPKKILQIGSVSNTCLLFFGNIAQKYAGQLYCIDPEITESHYVYISSMALAEYVTLIRAFSPWSCLEHITVPIDYLFIDTHQSTRWILANYHYWFKYTKVGGIIAFNGWNSLAEGANLRESIDLIRETDSKALETVGEAKSLDIGGTIAFRKVMEEVLNPHGF